MANIVYRGAAAPTAVNTAANKNAPLTNDEIDKNLFALNVGPTIGTTTISPGTSSTTLAGLTSVTTTRLLAGDGTAASPSITFASDGATDTGFYSGTDGYTFFTNNGVKTGEIQPGGHLVTVGDITVGGNLIVSGTTTTINSTTLTVDDINIELGSVASPSDATANGGGITLKGASDKTIAWDSTNSNWTSNQDWNLVTGKAFEINAVSVLNATTLGSSVVNSSLTKLGTGAGFVKSDASGNLTVDTSTYSLSSHGHFIGTTAVQASSANQAVTGILSVTGGAASNFTLKTADVASAATGILYIVSGDVTAGNASSGSVGINSGNGFGTQSAGSVSIYSGDGGASSTTGGNVSIQGGGSRAATSTGGNVSVRGGSALSTATTAATGGNVFILGGRTYNASGTKAGGNVYIDGGIDGSTASQYVATAGTVNIGNNSSGVGGAGTSAVNIGSTSAITTINGIVKLPTVGTSGLVKLGAGGQLSADTTTYATGNGTATGTNTGDQTIGDGALTVSSSAGATNTSATLALSGAYSANTATARSLNFTVGPALTNLSTFMTTATAGFIKRTAQDTYAIDTTAYYSASNAPPYPAEADTLATVTGRGASTTTLSTFSGGLNASGGLNVSGGALTVSKIGTDSLITFPAQTNDPGYIKHYENNNTAVMYFSVSDDAGSTDYFSFGGTSGAAGAFAEGLKLTAGGIITVATWNANSIATSYTDAKIKSITGTAPISVSDSAGAVTLSHATSGVTAGTWNNVTVNTLGHVTSGSNTAYLTAEADTLATVTARGASTTTASTFSGGITGTLTGNASSATNAYVGQTTNTVNYDYLLCLAAGVDQNIALKADGSGGPTYNPLRNALSLDGFTSHIWAYPALQLGRDWSISQDASSYSFAAGCKATTASAWTGTGSFAKAMRFSLDPNAGTFYWYVKPTDTADTTTSISFRTAMSLDISGNLNTNGAMSGSNLSGTNTGDETLATIKTKLGVTTLSGANTGDQTLPTTLPASDVYAWAKATSKPSYAMNEISSAALSATSGAFTGNITINNGSPTIYLQDTDNRSCMLHCNDNTLYVLRGDGTNSSTWATYNGLWPMQVNLENNDFTSGGNVTAYSDARLKENVSTINSALDKTLKLRGVYYNRIGEVDRQRVGVIAQEIKEVLPEVVISNIDPETKQDTLSVDYGNITALLIEAIKELNAKVEDLQNQLANK